MALGVWLWLQGCWPGWRLGQSGSDPEEGSRTPTLLGTTLCLSFPFLKDPPLLSASPTWPQAVLAAGSSLLGCNLGRAQFELINI